MELPPSKRSKVLKEQRSGDGSLMLSASSRVTLPADIVEGGLLPKLASENLASFQAVLPPGHSRALGRVEDAAEVYVPQLTWASCCSGSEGIHYVMEAANKAMADAGVLVRFKHKFSCEIAKPKQKWINMVLSAGPLFEDGDRQVEDQHCIFTDIRSLGGDTAQCCVHKKACEVVQVDCLLLGTSCKDLSRANSSTDRTKLVLSQETSKGASAQTFRGMLEYCKAHKPPLLIYENVDAIDDKVSANTETNLSLLMQAMADLGYQGQKVMTDAQEFGLPCRRRRLYVFFVCVASEKIDLQHEAIGQVFAKFRTLVTACMRSPPCVTACLLKEDNSQQHADILLRALAERRDTAAKNAQNPKKAEATNTWIDKHILYADQLGVRWSAPVAAELTLNDWYDTLTVREGDALVLSKKADPSSVFRNLSQSLGRINSKSSGVGKEVAPTMLPGQLLWIEGGQKRLLTGEEALILQGFPILKLQKKMRGHQLEENWTQSFLHDLAGNAMALPVALAIFQAGLACVSWAAFGKSDPDPEPEENTDGACVDIALAALETLRAQHFS